MKTKTWIILILVLLVLSIGLSAWVLRPREAASHARITSGGKLIQVLDLDANYEYTVELPGGSYNTVTVKDGKIAVTDASCPDHYCMKRGFLNSGTDIVCLPNGLVISFVTDAPEIDAAIG